MTLQNLTFNGTFAPPIINGYITDVDIITNYCDRFLPMVWSLIMLCTGIILFRVFVLGLFDNEPNLYNFLDATTDTILIISMVVLMGYAIAVNGLYDTLKYSVKLAIVLILCIIAIVVYRRGYIDKIIHHFKNI